MMDYLMTSGRRVVIRREGFAGERRRVLPAEVVRLMARHPVMADLHPVAAGHFPSAAGHLVIRPDGVPEYILMMCVAGHGWCRYGGRHWRVNAGQAIVVPRGLPHSYGTTKRRPWSIYWAHFKGTRAASMLRFMGVDAVQPILHCGQAGEAVFHFESMLDRLSGGATPQNLWTAAASLRQILAFLSLRGSSGRAAARSAMEKTRGTVDFMRGHLARPMRIADFARHAGLSVPHYSALFRRAFGCPPIAYFLRLKMQDAAVALTSSQAPVAEIASRFGFGDPYYFSRLFRKNLGMAPAHFRIRHREGSARLAPEGPKC